MHHVKLMCFIEMLARTAKNILFDSISQITKERKPSHHSVDYFDRELRVHLVDFLNLLFGDSAESSVFWSEVLCSRASQYYLLDSNLFRETETKVNALYYAFLDLTGIKEVKVISYHARRQNKEDLLGLFETEDSWERDDATKRRQHITKPDFFFKNFFKSANPFGDKEKAWSKFEFGMRSKVYQFKFLPYQVKAESSSSYLNDQKIEKAIKSCHMKRNFKNIPENGLEDIMSIYKLC